MRRGSQYVRAEYQTPELTSNGYTLVVLELIDAMLEGL